LYKPVFQGTEERQVCRRVEGVVILRLTVIWSALHIPLIVKIEREEFLQLVVQVLMEEQSQPLIYLFFYPPDGACHIFTWHRRLRRDAPQFSSRYRCVWLFSFGAASLESAKGSARPVLPLTGRTPIPVWVRVPIHHLP